MLARLLDFAGYSYVREFQFDDERRWRVDFLIKPNLAVEVEGVRFDGFARHQTLVGFTGDCEKYNRLTELGYQLLRFTPDMIKGKAKSSRRSKPLPMAMKTIANVMAGEEVAAELDYSRKGYIRGHVV